MSDVILRDSVGAETPLLLSSPRVARLCHATLSHIYNQEFLPLLTLCHLESHLQPSSHLAKNYCHFFRYSFLSSHGKITLCHLESHLQPSFCPKLLVFKYNFWRQKSKLGDWEPDYIQHCMPPPQMRFTSL